MKRSIRFFAIGLLTSTILLFGYYFFFEQSDNLETVSTERLIATIEEDGYRVITEDEFISYSLMNKEENEEDRDKEDSNKENKDKADDAEKPDENEDGKIEDDDKTEEVITTTFTTKEGVVSQDIADILVEKNIIDDRQKFLDYLDDNDYSAYIQLGKFEVSSDMTLKELAEIITTYPGN